MIEGRLRQRRRKIAKDSEIPTLMKEITEAHARVLVKVCEDAERARLLKATVEEHFCTRELRSIIGRPKEFQDAERRSEMEWTSDNIRNKFDNSDKLVTKHGRVCVFRTDSANFLISQLRISPHKAGEEIGRAAGKVLSDQGIDPTNINNWSSILIEKTKYAGWGKFSTTTDSMLVVHDPTLNSEFLRGYFEGLLGVKLKLVENRIRVQVFEILRMRANMHKPLRIPAL